MKYSWLSENVIYGIIFSFACLWCLQAHQMHTHQLALPAHPAQAAEEGREFFNTHRHITSSFFILHPLAKHFLNLPKTAFFSPL